MAEKVSCTDNFPMASGARRDLAAAAFAASLDALVLLDAEGRVLDLNPAAEQLLGRDADGARGAAAQELFLPQGVPERSGRRLEMVRTAAGEVVGVELTASPAEDGVLLAMRPAYGTGSHPEWRFDAVLSHLPGLAVLVFDTEMRVIEVHAADLAGYSQEEMLGRPIPEILPGAAELHERYRAVLHGEAQSFEWRAVRRPGVWWSIDAVPISDAHGTVLGGLVLARDIGQRKRDEARLRLQSRVVEEIDAAVLAVSLEGSISFWNRGAEELLGLTASEATGQPTLDVLGFADPQVLEEVSETVRHGGTWRGEADIVRRDGSSVPVYAICGVIEEPERIFIGVAVDISDRRAAEARLRESEERFRTIIESSRDGVWTLDADDRTTFVNPRMADMLGYRPEELLGRPVADFIDPDDLPALRRSLERRRKGVGDEREVRLVRKDGERIHTIVSTNPLLDADGAYTGSLSMVTDITERVLDEREREQLRAALHQSQKLESVGRLAGGVAHDFNNLLSVIINYAQFVAEDVADRPQVAADVAEIVAAAERAAGLTRQLLVFSRRDVSRPTVLDVGEVLEDMEKLLRRTLGADIALNVEREPGARVRVDRGQLEQMLLNVVLNARDAMPSGGELTVRAERRELGAEYLRARPGLAPGPYVVLSVSDTGVGMDPVVLGRALEPFFTTKPPGQGTGLGLATVYGVVTEAGGQVELRSERGKGTTVRIHLPAVDAPVGDDAAGGGAAPRGAGERVLIVEDEAPVRELAARVLREHGYAVESAPDGQAALARVGAGPAPDLLLTDIVMPGMSGPELADALRRDHPELPVLYTSGYTDDALVRHGIREDHVAFLPKPFTAAALLEKVRQTLGG